LVIDISTKNPIIADGWDDSFEPPFSRHIFVKATMMPLTPGFPRSNTPLPLYAFKDGAY